jgi:hypothetical protein
LLILETAVGVQILAQAASEEERLLRDDIADATEPPHRYLQWGNGELNELTHGKLELMEVAGVGAHAINVSKDRQCAMHARAPGNVT